MLRHPPGGDDHQYWDGSIDLVDELVRRDATITPGKLFGVENAFRVGYGMATADFNEGLSRLGEALAIARAKS